MRFTNDATAGIPPQGQPWEGTRVLYLMHASDPIVWWSPRLLFTEPDWTGEPPGKDVLAGVTWLPLVTFWQVTADLTFAGGVPQGHGHNYRGEYADAWYAVLQPTGVTPDQLTALRAMAADAPDPLTAVPATPRLSAGPARAPRTTRRRARARSSPRARAPAPAGCATAAGARRTPGPRRR